MVEYCDLILIYEFELYDIIILHKVIQSEAKFSSLKTYLLSKCN